jgi:hypothetical protein
VYLGRIDTEILDVDDIVAGLPRGLDILIRHVAQTTQTILENGKDLNEITIHAPSKSRARELSHQLTETMKGCALLERPL